MSKITDESNVNHLGEFTVLASKFKVLDDTDSSKVLNFDVSGVTSGETSTFAVPDSDGTFVTLDGTQTLTNKTLTNAALNTAGGTLVLPTSAAPAQTAEGSVFWDSNDDLLTVGDGSGLKTMVDLSATQTITGTKTFTGAVVIPVSATPAQTAEGSIVWDSDDDLLTVGDGASRKTMVDLSATQTITGTKTFSGAVIVPTSASPAQTAEGSVVWDSDDDLLTVGDGTGRKTMVDLSSTQSVTGAKTFSTAHISAGNITPTTVNRVTQSYFVPAPGLAKVGAGAGWVVAAASNTSRVTLPTAQTASTLVLPIVGLKVGWTITGFHLVGQIESAGNAVTIDASLFKLTAAAADLTDASIGAITQIAVTADTEISAANSTKTLDTPEVVAANESFYLLITGTTTTADCDVDLMGAMIIVTEV